MKLPILVVDDNQDVGNTMSSLLAAFGYEADVAFDGPTALQLVDRRQYGLAILDYQMPDMNGYDLYQRIRQARPSLAAIFITAFADVLNTNLGAGVLHVFPKPVNIRELIAIIEQRLGEAA